ncbi:molybdopterin molybdotransferase MoeA [Flavobacterium psychrolimnae]|uniref:Molybdopterin molybdenumtransferase n=1 Tax=Flavobacterium psychrolimnae TaxID=249351 RepID=A0A366AX71_9FLAO|nr:gephyrin-like molybdotransferase Glp [Flavobacterium psychrolimnae]RBN49251.1 molybdopterin molybdenumtransferase MoeA [Flavobacterium psychrolimnae]
MISVKQAKQIIIEAALPKKSVLLPLSEAFGLVTSKGIIATTDIPNFAQSSMDGYALKYEDKGNLLKVIGEMAAGISEQIKISKGEATRIFTGAPLPLNADTVVMQEKIHFENNLLIVQDENLKQGSNVRSKGAEVKQGDIAMVSGMYLSAAAIGFLAGIGCVEVSVYAPPKVAIILTGNELQKPGNPLEFGQVYEANSFQLKAALNKIGIKNSMVLTAEDDPEELQKVLQKALEVNDVVLLNGGVSVGDYDFVTQAAHTCGVEEKFHKIKQKPGKPLFFGTKEDKLVFGLPGNPSSSLTCFYEYVLPALESSMGLHSSLVEITASVTHDYPKPAGLTHFLKAFYSNGKVTPLHAQESFRLHSFAQANCFIILPEESIGCKAGAIVTVHLLPL